MTRTVRLAAVLLRWALAVVGGLALLLLGLLPLLVWSDL